ncbi:phage baseplate upper protein [Candidatus Bathyarchaeota archaeon]|nr:phage baseplate upper protein [Candidatus Bathyarchaeota archaeon]
MTADLHVDDIGTPLRFTVKEKNLPLNLANYDWLILHLEKKDKTVVDKVLTLVNDGSDGKAQYITKAGDIDQKGKWKAQIFYGDSSGSWHTSTVELVVDPNLCIGE